MFTQKRLVSPLGRGAVVAAVSALALTAIVPTEASARARHWHGGGGAAAAAAFAGIVGTGLAIAAAQNRNAYYDSYDGYYGGGPVYVAPGQVTTVVATAITAIRLTAPVRMATAPPCPM